MCLPLLVSRKQVSIETTQHYRYFLENILIKICCNSELPLITKPLKPSKSGLDTCSELVFIARLNYIEISCLVLKRGGLISKLVLIWNSACLQRPHVNKNLIKSYLINRFECTFKVSGTKHFMYIFRLFLRDAEGNLGTWENVSHTKLDLFLCQYIPMGNHCKWYVYNFYHWIKVE